MKSQLTHPRSIPGSWVFAFGRLSERAGALLKSTVSVVTANIASVMVDEEAESDFARLETKIDRLSAKLDEFANQRAG